MIFFILNIEKLVNIGDTVQCDINLQVPGFHKKKSVWPLFVDGFNCVMATEPLRGDSLLLNAKSPERLSGPWSHPVVLNSGPLD